MSRFLRWFVAAALLAAPPLAVVRAGTDGARLARPPYPVTRKDELVETRFGERVPDPYRWLENDARRDPAVADWVARQSAVTRAYLDRLPGRQAFAERLRRMLDYERFGTPRKAGSRYFYTRNAGLENQSALFVRDRLNGKPRLLLDPNTWSADGSIALDAWEPSRGGGLLAYSVQEAGSDWRTVRLFDVARGVPMADELVGVKYSKLAWVGDEGVLYSRFPDDGRGRDFVSATWNQGVWFHRVGTPQSADVLVYATPDHPEYGHTAHVTSDQRWVVISSSQGTGARRAVHAVDLTRRRTEGWRARPVVDNFAHDWRLVDGVGSRLWFVTDHGAPRYRLVSLDLARAVPRLQPVIPQRDSKLESARILGDRLVLSYLENGSTRAVLVDFSGKPAQSLSLTSVGTASGFGGRPGDPETFYSFTSFTQPPAVFRFDLRTGRSTPFAIPRPRFDASAYRIEQRWFVSRDGTRVPMYLVRSRTTASAGKAVPTLLYGYGGFEISLVPGFSALRMAWLEAGGAVAVANVRGGGEFGRDWHHAGRGANKQNAFDDFIAAGEYLIAQGIAPRDGLAIQGGSNGGLLVAAVLNQRPDLFAAANPDVGVMDMLRFDRFTAGRYWVDDYGDPDREADWRVLRAYSPYHNVRRAAYPAVLVTTADTDDRVVPAHSFKYAAALQASGTGDKPQLLRVETRAGHGAGRPTEKVIAGGADVLAFLAHWSGLEATE